ncbi:MAG: hypothetical protein AVO39_01205 [delta proteobacterium MLS_D]|jgi:glyceraldehyde-3-phosphate dehydrogenase type II|nr:MAG: hypothetical protein AVO39_01205 [delta proteobacterium MLS_D]
MSIGVLAMKKRVFVVGSGSIGTGVIRMLLEIKDKYDLDIFFTKKNPIPDCAPHVNALVNKGACFTPYQESREKFRDLGIDTTDTLEELLPNVHVIIDCTEKGVGLVMKRNFYEKLPKSIGILGQGSEDGFGVPYVYYLADDYLTLKRREGQNFVQVKSCNTTAISALIYSLCLKNNLADPGDFLNGRISLLRRDADVGQKKGAIRAPKISKQNPEDQPFGTHQAKDAYNLFKEVMSIELDIRSKALKLNSPFMHVVDFNFTFASRVVYEDILYHLGVYPLVALTDKESTDEIFGFGRDNGFIGHLFNQVIVPSVGIEVYGNELSGWAFTPQDGNSILSSVAAALSFIYPDNYLEIMKHFLRPPYIFTTV